MGTTRLQLYNNALLLLEERQLADLTEAREPRRVLDSIWDSGFIKHCLEQGYWNHATRAMQIDYDPDLTRSFGYRYGFTKPDDWIKTAAFCSDEFFKCPITEYSDEHDYWACDFQKIYVKIISSDPAIGFDLSRWPETFTRFAEAELAWRASPRINKEKTDKLERQKRIKLIDAKSKDAMNEPSRTMPSGSWVNSRMRGVKSRRNSRWDGGNG